MPSWKVKNAFKNFIKYALKKPFIPKNGSEKKEGCTKCGRYLCHLVTHTHTQPMRCCKDTRLQLFLLNVHLPNKEPGVSQLKNLASAPALFSLCFNGFFFKKHYRVTFFFKLTYFLGCSARTSHRGSFSCGGAQALGVWAQLLQLRSAPALSHFGSGSRARTQQLQSEGSVALERGLSSCGTRALSAACGIFLDQG